MAHYILWDDRVHTDPPICIENPIPITGLSKPIDNFYMDSEFCTICFKGKTIVKCKNGPKCFYSILPEKFNFLGKVCNLAELDRAIRDEPQVADGKLVDVARNFVTDIVCPSCGQTHRYTLKDIKII
ncbi:MAG: hypothetical protein ACREBB_09955 [Nitrosotalea sp.]